MCALSIVHMAWMRTVAGRLKSDFRYSTTLVYNSFPWASVTDTQKEKISQTAQTIKSNRDNLPQWASLSCDGRTCKQFLLPSQIASPKFQVIPITLTRPLSYH